ncbi:hypothetical protein LJC10_03105 [Selenomonadales bacterium OttesenSCG-928-I06]|nr:hypothetical protein [Selenomonadales bacterium OttesenSCG-928-I06]
MLNKIGSRLHKLEERKAQNAKTAHKNYMDNINKVIIYEPGLEEPDKSIELFREKYPDYKGAVVAIPDNGRDSK